MQTKMNLAQRVERVAEQLAQAKDSRKRAQRRVTKLTKRQDRLNIKLQAEMKAHPPKSKPEVVKSRTKRTAKPPAAAVAAGNAPAPEAAATPTPKPKRHRQHKAAKTEEMVPAGSAA